MNEVTMVVNSEQDRRILTLEEQMKKVYGHIATTNGELGNIKTDVAWLKKFFWIVATASIGGLVATILNLILQVE